ncbi:MAG: type I 3-dehydroquinate dehydratase [Deltaproteobacteria bacterium]|nr:type I 3-dehydroquinate dehydratase [Deltaproteobacteria bacterium]MBN2671089.1 type I 3-dehydroquinate dehydratase [Deltaproteobacteria bacterium]
MICVSLVKKNVSDVMEALKKVRLAEIRLETLTLTRDDVVTMFSADVRLVATCRANGQGEERRAEILRWAIEAGADYVDLEIETDSSFKAPLVQLAREKGCKVIVSYHNFEHTPDTEELHRIVETCFFHGADIAKVACHVETPSEAARIIGLGDHEKPVIPIGMGEMGRIARVAAPFVGSPFSYASMDGEDAAPGQIDAKILEKMYTYLKVM